MEEFDTIIEAVGKHTGYSKCDILHNKQHGPSKARHILFHIVTAGYPHLIDAAAMGTRAVRYTVWKGAREAEDKMRSEPHFLGLVNGIRRELKMPLLKKDATASVISDTKRMFGFDYSEEESLMMKRRMAAAQSYMDALCSHGEQPLEPGFFERRVRPKRTYKSWYKG